MLQFCKFKSIQPETAICFKRIILFCWKTIKLKWFLSDDDDDDDDVNGKEVYIYFVDFEKAFDIVD